MMQTERDRQRRTATATEVTVEAPSVTRTIGDVVEEAGVLRSQVSALRGDVEELHENANQVHLDAFHTLLDQQTAAEARQLPQSLLTTLAELGFSWRDVARLAGVSVSALRKWRNGGGVAPERRWQLARAVALCRLLADRPFDIQDVPSWLEMPMASNVLVAPLDMVLEGRTDLVLRWAAHADARPEDVLDEFMPDWRDRYSSRFEVFQASDGAPGIRLRK